MLPLTLTLVFAAAAIFIALFRRVSLPRLTKILLTLALLLLAVAATAPQWDRPHVQELLVKVDLSASTRTAAYRDRHQLEQRIHELLGPAPYRLEFFAADTQPDGHRFAGPQLPELAADRTRFDCPPDALAVLLFSDGQFDLPAAGPPIYPVIDPNLDRITDAAVQRLEIHPAPGGSELAVQISGGAGRTVTLEGVWPPVATTLPSPNVLISRALNPAAHFADARLSASDPWPENDALSIRPLPPTASQRWWIGSNPPDDSWHTLPPGQLPSDSIAWLAPSVVVFNNIPADALSAEQLERLQQYVRDLGGSVLLIGGDRAYAAGGYAGSALDAISPLASTPPHPTEHWLLLADSSGSMSEAATDDQSQWQAATSAMLRVLHHLPPSDLVSIGDFAQNVRWWSTGRSVEQTLALAPPAITPRGPTNLEAALMNIASQVNDDLPKQLLIISDVQAVIDHPDAVAAALNAKKIHLSVLAIGHNDGPASLRHIITATGGTLLRESVPGDWATAARKLAQQRMDHSLEHLPVTVHFNPAELPKAPPPREVPLWNHAWLKPASTQLDTAPAAAPLAARWSYGVGHVIGLAYPATPAEATSLADTIAQPPRDPRLRIHWQTGPQLQIRIDAADKGQFLNDLHLTLQLTDGKPMEIPQTAPGRYELSLDAPLDGTVATLCHDEQVIDRLAVPSRYAPEFNHIGNDHAALHALADRTGGEVIDPRQTTPIDIPWPTRQVPLTPILSIVAAALIAGGLLWWRR